MPMKVNEERYVRPSLSLLKEMFYPLGWDVVEFAHKDYPYTTTDIYIVHARPSGILSYTICQMLKYWRYEYEVMAQSGPTVVRLTNF